MQQTAAVVDLSARRGWTGDAMTTVPDKSGVMVGIGTVAKFLSVSEKQVYSFLKWGMPGSKISGVWYFHKNNVETWWVGMTGKPTRLDPEEAREAME